MQKKNGLYGYLSGFITSVTLQPFENIKMVLILPPKDVDLGSNFLKKIPKAAKFLYNDGGLKAFYRGLVPNVLRTSFSSSIFFSVLRLCEDLHQQYGIFEGSRLSSFGSSLVARVISSVVSNPLSVVETRYEYAGQERWKGGVMHSLIKIYQEEGFKGYFKGGLATCYKQGLFAGIFYTLYSEGKALGLNSFIAGILSGMISTSITHPFEIVRAEIQSFVLTQHSITKMSIFKQIETLFRSGEAFRGLAPRVIKKPLTNTMAFLMFEMMEKRGQQQ